MPRARETCASLTLRGEPADAGSVNRVTPHHVVVAGFLASVLVGLAILWSTFHVPVDRPWGWLYSAEKWDAVRTSFARRGFQPGSVHVVTATTLADGRQFALIGARTDTGRTCVAVARGTSIGATICRISKPVMVFYAREPRSILALVRGDVTVTMISQGHEGGIAAVPTGIEFAFNSSFIHPGDRLRARDAAGRVLANITAGR